MKFKQKPKMEGIQFIIVVPKLGVMISISPSSSDKDNHSYLFQDIEMLFKNTNWKIICAAL